MNLLQEIENELKKDTFKKKIEKIIKDENIEDPSFPKNISTKELFYKYCDYVKTHSDLRHFEMEDEYGYGDILCTMTYQSKNGIEYLKFKCEEDNSLTIKLTLNKTNKINLYTTTEKIADYILKLEKLNPFELYLLKIITNETLIQIDNKNQINQNINLL